VTDERAPSSLVRSQFCEVMWGSRSILQPRSTKVGGDVLFQCQARSLGLYACVIRNSFKPIVFFFRGCSDFPTQISDSFRKFGGCAIVFSRETGLFSTSHRIVLARDNNEFQERCLSASAQVSFQAALRCDSAAETYLRRYGYAIVSGRSSACCRWSGRPFRKESGWSQSGVRVTSRPD
jgi:hypothetical protein